MHALTLPLQAAIDPLDGIPRAVAQRRWLAPMLLAAVLTALSGAAVAAKVDPSATVLARMEMTGELSKATEREVEEAVGQASRIGIVGGVAKGLFLTPLWVLTLAVVLKCAAWLAGKKASFSALFTAGALALLPVALFHGIRLVSALRQDVLSPAMAEALVPSSLATLGLKGAPGLTRVYEALDVVNLWSAVVLGLGFAAAAGVARWRGAVLGVFLYALFAGAFLVGLPGVMAAASSMGGQ